MCCKKPVLPPMRLVNPQRRSGGSSSPVASTTVRPASDDRLAVPSPDGRSSGGKNVSIARLGYVLAIAANRRVHTHAGPIRVDALPALIGACLADLLRRRRGARATAVLVGLVCAAARRRHRHRVHHLLIRRNDTTGEHAYLRCYSARPVPLRTLVAVAGQRWRIEESFQAAKGLVGLDQHQVRRWTSWHRWTTLAMLAHAFLAVACAAERDTTPNPGWPDRVDRQRVPPTLRRPTTGHQPHHHQPADLVTMAKTTPIPSTAFALPTTPESMIPIYGCSISGGRHLQTLSVNSAREMYTLAANGGRVRGCNSQCPRGFHAEDRRTCRSRRHPTRSTGCRAGSGPIRASRRRLRRPSRGNT
jgi:hypothetical protein